VPALRARSVALLQADRLTQLLGGLEQGVVVAAT
jgi:hypothetical protein